MTDILITQSLRDTQVTEAGKPVTYGIRLANAPSAPVTITITTDGQTLLANPHKPLYRWMRIMPIGDSITYGVIDSHKNTQSGGYRTYLWQHLKADPYRINFVGSQASGPSSIDRNHEGYRGKVIDDIMRSVDGKIAQQHPNVVLLLAGTNDIMQNRDLAHAPQRLGHFIDQIFKQSPETAVLVGMLPPNTRSADNPHQIQTFNAAIIHLVNQRAHHDQKVRCVDFSSRLSTRDLADQIHPGARGYQKMAKAWYDSLIGVLNGPDGMFLSRQQTFTFTPRNWQSAQTVTVVANDDQDTQGKHQGLILHQAQSADTRYDHQAITLPITVIDNDPGLILIPQQQPNLLNEGSTTTYEVMLSSQPAKKVVVHLLPDPQLRLSRSQLTFTPNNWKQPQTVEVKALEDNQIGGSHRSIIRHQIQSRDLQYQDLNVNRIAFTIADNDSLFNTVNTATPLALHQPKGFDSGADWLLQGHLFHPKTRGLKQADDGHLSNFGVLKNNSTESTQSFELSWTSAQQPIGLEADFFSQEGVLGNNLRNGLSAGHVNLFSNADALIGSSLTYNNAT